MSIIAIDYCEVFNNFVLSELESLFSFEFNYNISDAIFIIAFIRCTQIFLLFSSFHPYMRAYQLFQGLLFRQLYTKIYITSEYRLPTGSCLDSGLFVYIIDYVQLFLQLIEMSISGNWSRAVASTISLILEFEYIYKKYVFIIYF